MSESECPICHGKGCELCERRDATEKYGQAAVHNPREAQVAQRLAAYDVREKLAGRIQAVEKELANHDANKKIESLQSALSSLQAKHDRLREALTACIAYMKDQRSYEVYRATLDAAELVLADEVTDEAALSIKVGETK